MTDQFEIIIVDDERDIREMVGEYLTDNGFSVRLTDGGDGLRALVAEKMPDLVLLDVRMPGEDGFTLARHLREHSDAAIVMLTAAGDPTERIVGLEMGADDYIPKPVNMRELLARLKAVLRRTGRPAAGERQSAVTHWPDAKRRLAAILAADVAGYSRLMSADEEATLDTLTSCRRIAESLIEEQEGRVFNEAGDSLVAEFASPIKAVRAAAEIQDALHKRSAPLPEEKRMLFRIGINLGDVMVEGGNLFGDGVNIAARLQSIAEAGEIYISRTIRDQVAGRAGLALLDLGERTLKHIPEPVHVYQVKLDHTPDRPDRPVAGGGAGLFR